jgi:hypothetical protein
VTFCKILIFSLKKLKEIALLSKEILMALFLPVIGVLTCLVVIFLRAMDGLTCQLDIVKVKSRIPRRKEYGKYPR